MSKQHLEAQRWLKSQRKKYPWRAVASAHISVPTYFTAASISRVTSFDCRTFCFVDGKMRDAFVETVETAEKAGQA